MEISAARSRWLPSQVREVGIAISTPGGIPPGAVRFEGIKPDPEVARKDIGPIGTPVLILAGADDSLRIPLAEAGTPSA